MALWTDIIDPATLTGYARGWREDYEDQQGTLARWLPNREVADTAVRFTPGEHGLTEVANYRAWDAEAETGRRGKARRVTIDLPAIGQNIPIGEYEQLRLRNASDDRMLKEILKTTRTVVRAVSDRIELTRGTTVVTGRATVNQANFGFDDDFGRSASHNVTAGTLWSDPNADRLGDLEAWSDVYEATNGGKPGAILLTRRGVRALANGTQFQTQLLNGAARPATLEEVKAVLASHDLPEIFVYNRKVNVGGVNTSVLDENRLLFLPAPVETDDDEGTQLGATFWGQTLSSSEPEWEIADDDQPGIVVGAFRNKKPPMIAEVVSDAIAHPVLANADLSFAAKIL
ncbi:major capsid protein [Oerskovia jenensis]|uniref:major capsid protein n=1 Tax=Oerskovia jenensis TaxID=162169 RepID=UPI0036D8851C